MNENDPFRDPIHELDRLREDLKGIKGLLKDIAQRVSQIERHVKRAFVPLTREPNTSTVPHRKRSKTLEDPPTIDSHQALVLFDELKPILASDGSEIVITRLEQMTAPNLKLIARELGLTFKSKPSKKVLSHKILGRMNESVMLSKNVNVTEPLNVGSRTKEPHSNDKDGKENLLHDVQDPTEN
jgi:hypothetical protein